MNRDLQKANLWKRISAAFFDGMMQCMLALGVAIIFTLVFHVSDHITSMKEVYDEYESSYSVKLNISSYEFEKMSEADQERYQEAVQALEQDERAVNTYSLLISMALLIITFSILIAVCVWEFVLPLAFGNGQTLGKKIFGIGLMQIDGIKVTTKAIFIRAILGKFTVEWMMPIYIVLLLLFNAIGIVGFIVLLLLLGVQIICLASTRVGALLHDVFAGTVAVDLASQRIFNTKEEQIEYVKKLHAEKAAAADY